MRAHEFISEAAGKLTKRQQESTVGLTIFASSEFDRSYDLNRVMMAVAASDGETIPDMNKESWSGKQNTAHPYTELEQQMLEKALAAAGVPSEDLNRGDLRSLELDSINTKSPINAFKGYKK